MNDDPSLRRSHADASVEAKRLAAFRQALIEADAADVILLGGTSREDWLAQLDRALADDRDLSDLPSWPGEAPAVGA